MQKGSKDSKTIQLDIMMPYGVAVGAILGMLLAFSSDNVAYLVYGIIIGLLAGIAIGAYLFKKTNNTKKK